MAHRLLVPLIVLTAALYLPSIRAPFVYEDLNAPVHPTLMLTVPGRILSNWSFRLTATSAPLAHGVNVAVHLVNGLLVCWVGALVAGPIAGLGAAVVLLLWPLNSQAVLYVIGREDLLVTGFVLIAVLASLSNQWVLMSVALVAAALTKEIGLIGLPLIAWTRLILRRDARLLALGGGVGVLLVAWEGRGLLTLLTLPPGAMGPDVPWLAFVTRQIGLTWALLTGWEPLSIDHDALALSAAWLTFSLFATALVLGLLGWAWRRRPLLAWSLGFVLLALAPRILVGSNEFVAERHLYLPIVGLAVGGGALVASFCETEQTCLMWT